jgi:hypothetical protein
MSGAGPVSEGQAPPAAAERASAPQAAGLAQSAVPLQQRHPGLYISPAQSLPLLPMGGQIHKTIQYLQPDLHQSPRCSVAPSPLVGSSGALRNMAQEQAPLPLASPGSAAPRMHGQHSQQALHFLPSHKQGYGAVTQPADFVQPSSQLARAGMHFAAPRGSFFPFSVDQSRFVKSTCAASEGASPASSLSAQRVQTPQELAAQAVAQQVQAAQQLSGLPHAHLAHQIGIDALMSSERLIETTSGAASGVGSATAPDAAKKPKRRSPGAAADGVPAGEPRKKAKREPTVAGVLTDDGVTVIFPCSKCEKSFESRAALSGHTRFCSGGMWRCEWCDCKETETPSKARAGRPAISPRRCSPVCALTCAIPDCAPPLLPAVVQAMGPSGAKTLCNACGSRYRAGHTSMPERDAEGHFICSNCNRTFSTIGALGGHRRFCDSGSWRCSWCRCKHSECSGKVSGAASPPARAGGCSRTASRPGGDDAQNSQCAGIHPRRVRGRRARRRCALPAAAGTRMGGPARPR